MPTTENNNFGGEDSKVLFADDDIVITGISGRFPMADNLQEFGDNLFNKTNCIVRAEDRWSSELTFLPDNHIGALKNLEKFDAEFFNVNAIFANMEDLQIRMLSEACFEAIIDSGYDPKDLRGKNIGVIVGMSDAETVAVGKKRYEIMNTKGSEGYLPCMTANKLSYRCDITGSSFILDSACSSSASALEVAFRKLKAGTIEGALVGAASVCLDPRTHKTYLDAGILSANGETSSYSEKANGSAVGEAVAIVFIQKKKDARRIYAKIHNVKCTVAVNQPAGMYAPSLKDQLNLYEQAYNVIGMDPSLVDYIEGNGSSTLEADATEVNSIDEVFCKNRKAPLLLGTVKSNIGHTKTASALCSIAKVIIAFETGTIPPTILSAAPNPGCPSLTNGKIRIVTETEPYDRPFAAINNFSFGGAIAHLVLERNGVERCREEKGSMLNIPKLIVYAATTKEALTNMFNCFQENAMPNEFFGLLNKSAYPSLISAPYRGLMIVKKDIPPVRSIEKLTPVKREVWYLLTGITCSQWLGISLELMDMKAFAESLRKSADVLEPFGINLLKLLDPSNLQQDREITSTLVTITAIQIAVVDILNTLGLEPDGIVGHGTGELVCAYADGCCTAEQTILLAYHIGVSVDTADLPLGAMAVIGLTREEVKRRCPERVYTACHDAEECVTVSGSAKAVEGFVEALKKEHISANVINTHGIPFHCRNISEAIDKCRNSLKMMHASVRPRSKRWRSTSYSEHESNEQPNKNADADYYCHNLESEVHFKEALVHIPSNAIIIEIGPHFLVSSALKKAIGNQASYINIPERTDNGIDSILLSIGKLYNLGLDPQVENLYEPVSFPVPRGTPMISPLIQWDHSKSFKVPKYRPETVAQHTFFVKSNSTEKFLLDHCIEGRPLYPATGYVYLAWKSLSRALNKPMESLPVCIENFKILRATILNPNDGNTFSVTILDKCGDFEITEGGSIVATGTICVSEKTMIDDSIHHYEPSEPSVMVSGPQMYNELKIHGYEYGPAFQGLLEVNIEGTHGFVKWNEEWISFLDSLLLFFGIIYENDDFKLPTGARSISIDPRIHMDFVTRMKEKEFKGIPVKYDKHTRTCTAAGVEIRDLKLERAPHRSTSHNAPVLEEYSFVPYYAESAVFGIEKNAKFESYMQVCNDLAKQIVHKLNNSDTLRRICEDIKFNEDIKVQENLFNVEENLFNVEENLFNVEENLFNVEENLLNVEENYVLLKSLRTILEITSSSKPAPLIKEVCQNIPDILFEDMLFKCMLNEKPLRSIIDVAVENCMGKMQIAEWCDTTPLLLTAVQDMMKCSNMIKASYILIHSHTAAFDIENLNERDIQVEPTGSGDVIPSNLKDSCHLGVTCCMAESTNDLKSRIHNIASLVKEEGFALLIHKHRLIPAEMLMFTLGKMSFTLDSEDEIEKLFQEVMLSVVSKQSTSFGITAYLLRKVPKKPLPPEVYVVKLLDAKYEQWVEDLKKSLSTVQEKRNSGIVLLVAQDTIINGIIGLVNCLKQEPGGHTLRCIFTDRSAPAFDLRNIFYSDILDKNLLMNVYINGTWGSFRHTSLSEDISEELSDCASIQCAKCGNLSSLHWRDSPLKCISAEDDDNELFHVYYSSLNFRDVMIATGKISAPVVKVKGYQTTTAAALGYEFSGRDKNGRRVMAVTTGASICNTYVNKPLFIMDVPHNWTLEEAATVPVVYVTCYFALIKRGELQHGESILIHSGTGGIGQAAIRIALSMDCEIFATVGTPEKKDFLMKTFPQLKPENIGCSRNTTFEEMIMRQTKGMGVDVVLNSLADDKFQASVRCLGSYGRFLEIGKYDLLMDSALELQIFLKGISFHSCQLDSCFESNKRSKDLFANLKFLMTDGIQKGVVKPLNTTVFPRNQVEKAFRYMGSGKHIGKVLVKIREEEQVKVEIPSPLMLSASRNLRLCSNKSYIIVGGLGGFGIELAKWLVQKGAGTVILTSRYGARTPYHHLCLKRWKDSGAGVFVSTLDVSKRDEAQRLLEETNEKYGPLGGIFNSAVVLKDAFIENQSASAFEEVCAPKALATKHLDELTRSMCPEVDMFVCFSSISCGKGNAGQTNYGYANSVMERICEQRKKDGLHGLAIQWGIIGDVGLVHRHMGDDAMIAGVMAQKIKSCLQSLETFLLHDKAVVSSFLTADKSKMMGKTGNILSQLAKIFGFTSTEEMNPHRTFEEIGMDSITAAELSQLLQSSFDITLSMHEIQNMKIGDVQKLIDSHDMIKGPLTPPGQNIQNINFNGPQPSLAREAVVSVNNIRNGVPVFVIHGNDFLYETHQHLYEGLSHPVFALQSNNNTPTISLKDMSQWFLDQIQKVCPRAPIHLVSVASSGSLALEMALLSEMSKGQQPEIISLTILDGSLNLMDLYSSTEHEKKKNAAMYEASDLCEFLSAFSDFDIAELKKYLEAQQSLKDRINTVSSLLTTSDKSSFLAAAELHVRKQILMRFHIPEGKIEKDVTAIEAAEKVLPNDVSALKSFFSQVCDGKVTIHRTPGNGNFLVEHSSAVEVATLLNTQYRENHKT